MESKILEGVRVVELGTHVAVPFCGRQLAELGAEVIKVEAPRGDWYRPFAKGFRLPYTQDSSFLYEPYNIGKRDISLDLTDKDAQTAMLKLLSTADVFLTNTRESKLDKVGLDIADLRKRFPKLIIGIVNGYGTKGPKAELPGYDLSCIWSGSGVLTEWSFAEDRQLFKPFFGWGDAIAAAHLTIGIEGALYKRLKTDEGDVVRVSLLGVGLWQNATGILRYQEGMEFPASAYQAMNPMERFWKTKDGKWISTTFPTPLWEAKCSVLFDLWGTPELKDDPNWATLEGYLNAEDTPNKMHFIEEHMEQLTADEIVAALRPANIVLDVVSGPQDVLKNEDAWANGYLHENKTVDGKDIIIPSSPIRFESASDESEFDYPPAERVGQESVAILESLGYNAEEIEALISKGAVVTPEQYDIEKYV